MRIGNLHAWISMDGVELTEFATEVAANGKEVSCWVPSECGKEFCIHAMNTDSSSKVIVNALPRVDGVACRSRHLRYKDSTSRRTSTATFDSIPTGPSTRRRLLFGQQVLSDDDSLLSADVSPELGSIIVKMRVVKNKPRSRDSHRESWRDPKTQILHERSKKAIGHTVQFGAEFMKRNAPGVPHDVVKYLATFVFKYRPIDLLRAEGIAPPIIRSQPYASARSDEVLDLTLDDDDAAEIKRLEARLLELKSKGVRVKSEPRVKAERVSGFAQGEIIDLT
ncbi:hypothetical protein R3P38DRAFT_1704009 [Favolaschia claudopus]|uniref:DUF7918 domain-containing protein n=1 Tax=Favolaschia claudopus TaxID=2862362 RepID=A0AAW0ABL4_9AGAR